MPRYRRLVQTAEDVATLQAELAHLRPDDWNTIALVLKIETGAPCSIFLDIIGAPPPASRLPS
jgi:pyruvate kinase